jgi:predicted Zn-dependent protease with MMP-like domain
MMIASRDFQRLVSEALDELPPTFRERLDNLAIEVEDWPDPETLRLAGAKHPQELQGFYHGVPLPRRNHGYHLVSPDRISIYRQPILLHCRTAAEVRVAVRRVLLHEIAHHFGIDDDRLAELGAY